MQSFSYTKSPYKIRENLSQANINTTACWTHVWWMLCVVTLERGVQDTNIEVARDG